MRKPRVTATVDRTDAETRLRGLLDPPPREAAPLESRAKATGEAPFIFRAQIEGVEKENEVGAFVFEIRIKGGRRVKIEGVSLDGRPVILLSIPPEDDDGEGQDTILLID